MCMFDRLRTARDKQSLENLLATHTFDYIVLRVKPGLTSCKDLATALQSVAFKCR